MKTIIRKCPTPTNFMRKSMSLTQAEFDIVNNAKLESEIQLFETYDGEPVQVISKKQYKKLSAVPRTHRETGERFYVVDFSGVR